MWYWYIDYISIIWQGPMDEFIASDYVNTRLTLIKLALNCDESVMSFSDVLVKAS